MTLHKLIECLAEHFDLDAKEVQTVINGELNNHTDDLESRVLDKSQPLNGQPWFFDNSIGEIDRFLSTSEAASMLRISEGTLFNYVSNGVVPRYKIGSKNLYKRSELLDLVRSGRIGGQS